MLRFFRFHFVYVHKSEDFNYDPLGFESEIEEVEIRSINVSKYFLNELNRQKKILPYNVRLIIIITTRLIDQLNIT